MFEQIDSIMYEIEDNFVLMLLLLFITCCSRCCRYFIRSIRIRLLIKNENMKYELD